MMCMEFYLTTSIITVDQRYMPEMIPDYYYRKRGHIMGFTKKTWKNRIAEYINRRLITMEDGSTSLVTVARDEGTISQEGDAFNAANMNDLEDRIEAGFADVSQSLTNVNNSKKTYIRLVLPNIAADAKAVCDYINKNYLMGQITPMYSIEFDVVASNTDWFSGVLSTDSNVDSNARTVWGIVQRRSISADNSTLYKYFGMGTGGAGTVSPFKRYEDGYNTGYAAGQSAGVPSGSCIAGWRSIDSYSNGQWVTGWVGVNPNFFTVNSAGIIPVKNFTATVYWQGYNKRDIDFFSNGAMGHRDNGTSLDGVRMNFYAGTQCGFKTNDSGGGSLGAGFIVLN